MPHAPCLGDFQAVLFDVDGTLVDSLFGITQALGDAIFRFSGVRPEDSELRPLVGLPLLQQMSMYSQDRFREMADYAIDRMRAGDLHEKYFEGAVQCLKLCHDHGIKTALVTSKNAIELAEFLPSFPHRNSVDTAVCASDVSLPKPSPESAFLACRRLGVTPTQCAFVGDSVYDMRCGRSAGMTCIAVAYGAGSKESLEEEHPELLFETPEALLAWAAQSLTLTPCHERK
jgi:HAD superfamily hydrolase (TIGR01509 family)